jgi:hypothetical protein
MSTSLTSVGKPNEAKLVVGKMIDAIRAVRVKPVK